MHIFTFSREYFIKRQNATALWPAKHRLIAGIGLAALSVTAVVLPLIFWQQLLAIGSLPAFLTLALLIALVLLDAGYHKLKGAILELATRRPPPPNHSAVTPP
jgi:hypothetical protein